MRGQTGVLALLDAVLSAVDVPVLAAGGIGSGRALAAVLAAGADGARIGTRFVAAEEADAHPRYIEALIAANPTDTLRSDTFALDFPGAPHRALRSSVAAVEAFQGDVVGEVFRLPLRRPRAGAPVPEAHHHPPRDWGDRGHAALGRGVGRRGDARAARRPRSSASSPARPSGSSAAGALTTAHQQVRENREATRRTAHDSARVATLATPPELTRSSYAARPKTGGDGWIWATE